MRAKPKGAKRRNLTPEQRTAIHRCQERCREDEPKLRRALERLGDNGRGSKAPT